MRITTVLQIGSAICGLAAASPAIAKSEKFQTIYAFGSMPKDGAYPSAPLISAKGVLYGTTALGGPDNGGTVYTIDPATGAEAVVSNLIGGEAFAPVTFYKHNLFGTTTGGDTIFSIDIKTKHVTNLHNFPDGGDEQPAQPNGLTEFGGMLFGTTVYGGHLGCGYVFRFDPNGKMFSRLHTFTCGVDGIYPDGSLVVYTGLLYGVTERGGPAQSGTIFSIDPATGTKKTLYSLDCASDGCFPTGIVFYKGVMLGSALNGGASDSGTLFTFDPATLQYTTFFAFPGGAGGCEPIGAPVVYKGKLYGVASGCINTNKYGVLYEVSLKTGTERVLHSFTNGLDGGSPDAGLLLYQGALYGTTSYGGADTNGTVFRYAP
jgi:uncharacterized repeat protein (TIGR03803 family)